jgi:hypothetical protein
VNPEDAAGEPAVGKTACLGEVVIVDVALLDSISNRTVVVTRI